MKAIWVVMLAACSAISPKATETLAESVRAYNDGVRWERFSVAATHVPAEQRTQFVDDADERAKDIKITDYEVLDVDKHGDREAKVHLKLSWYRASEGTLRETRALQTWERHGKLWVLVDEARLRGAEMPGLPEPLAAEPASGSEVPASQSDAAPQRRGGRQAAGAEEPLSKPE